MSEKYKKTHNNFCNYEIAKAKSSRNISVRKEEYKPLGLRTSDLSKAMLVQQLASLFNI